MEQAKREKHAETELGNVASYLWKKGNDRSIELLEELLKTCDNLVPESYGVDPFVGEIMPKVSPVDDTSFGSEGARDSIRPPWPITLAYNPVRKLDKGQLLYMWRIVAATFLGELAGRQGIPVPMRLKLDQDSALSQNDFGILTPFPVAANGKAPNVIPRDSSASRPVDENWKPPNGRVYVRLEQDDAVILDHGRFGVPRTGRERNFFDKHKDQWGAVKRKVKGVGIIRECLSRGLASFERGYCLTITWRGTRLDRRAPHTRSLGV